MNIKRLFRYWFPIIPFLFLGLALFGVVIAIDTQSENNTTPPSIGVPSPITSHTSIFF